MHYKSLLECTLSSLASCFLKARVLTSARKLKEARVLINNKGCELQVLIIIKIRPKGRYYL